MMPRKNNARRLLQNIPKIIQFAFKKLSNKLLAISEIVFCYIFF